MASQPQSLFAASREAAKQIMENRQVIRFETTDDSRIREHLVRTAGLTDAQVTDALEGYHIIMSARRMLSM
jgi:hypothetical protein